MLVTLIYPDLTVAIYNGKLVSILVVRSKLGDGASVLVAPLVILNLKLYL